MSQTSSDKTYYLVCFRDPKEGEIMELKARRVEDSTLGLSFVRISDFIFETKGIVVKPSEEQLQKKLENVKSLHLNLYSIVSIEEIGQEHRGLQFKRDKSNVLVLPSEQKPQPNP